MIILTRHCSTDWNDTNHELVRGHLDIPLNDKGRREAERLAEKIAAKYKPKVVWSDNLERSKDTAQAIARKTGATHFVDERLGPWNIGKLAGQYKEEVLPTIRFLVENPNAPLADGESYNTFYQRWEARLNQARRSGDGDVYVIHSSNFHATPSILAGSGPEYDPGNEVSPGDYTVIK